jgi:hypothetical protein
MIARVAALRRGGIRLQPPREITLMMRLNVVFLTRLYSVPDGL